VIVVQAHFLLTKKALNFALHFLQEKDFYLGAGRHRKAEVCGTFYKPCEAEGKRCTKA
jgi:hypothetical protein